MTDSEAETFVDPKAVTCGFLMVPSSLVSAAGMPPISMAHQALDTNQGKFWAEVRRQNAGVKIHLVVAPDMEAIRAILVALDKLGELENRSIVVGQLRVGPPGASGTDVYAGFCWRDDTPRVIVAKSNRILPGVPTKASEAKGGKRIESQGVATPLSVAPAAGAVAPAAEAFGGHSPPPERATKAASSGKKKWWKFW